MPTNNRWSKSDRWSPGRAAMPPGSPYAGSERFFGAAPTGAMPHAQPAAPQNIGWAQPARRDKALDCKVTLSSAQPELTIRIKMD